MAEYHAKPFTVGEIEDGLVPLVWPDGTVRYSKLRNARIETARMVRALAEYDAKSAEVVPIKQAARS